MPHFSRNSWPDGRFLSVDHLPACVVDGQEMETTETLDEESINASEGISETQVSTQGVAMRPEDGADGGLDES
jgi:hypothetical protein